MSDLGSRGLRGRWGGGLSKIPLKGSGTEEWRGNKDFRNGGKLS